VLEYIGLDDAEHMLSVANEQERQWLQPMVQKKAQQTMQNPKAPSWLRAQATQLNDRIGRTLFPDELLEGTQ
jgi:phage terminase small subunit